VRVLWSDGALFSPGKQHSLTLVFKSYQVCKWQVFIGPLSDWMSKSNRKSTMVQVFHFLTIFNTTSTYLSSNIHGPFRHVGGIMMEELSLPVMGLGEGGLPGRITSWWAAAVESRISWGFEREAKSRLTLVKIWKVCHMPVDVNLESDGYIFACGTWGEDGVLSWLNSTLERIHLLLSLKWSHFQSIGNHQFNYLSHPKPWWRLAHGKNCQYISGFPQ